MSNTNSTPSFLIDSILHDNIKQTEKYNSFSPRKKNKKLFYSYSHCENQTKFFPQKTVIPMYQSENYQNYNTYPTNVYSYYNPSSKLSHSTSVVNLSNLKHANQNQQQSPTKLNSIF